MKPHEQEWKALSTGLGWSHIWNGKEGIAREVPDEVARFIAAAPDMARLVIGPNGTGHHRSNDPERLSCNECAHWEPTHDPTCAVAATLRKAGVLP